MTELSYVMTKDIVVVIRLLSCSVMSNSLDPMDCIQPGSSVHGISQARILEWAAFPFIQGIFLTQGLNVDLSHCRQILYRLSHNT